MVLSLVAMLGLVSSSCPGPVRTQLQLDLENVHDNDLGDVVIDTVRDMGHDYDVDLEDIRNDIDVNEIFLSEQNDPSKRDYKREYRLFRGKAKQRKKRSRNLVKR